MNHLGVDCGKKGGIAYLRGDKLSTLIMPTVPTGKKAQEKINLIALGTILKDLLRNSNGELTAIIEDPGGHAPSAAGLRSMTYSFAVTEMCCAMLGIKYETIMSRAWQKHFWPRPKLPKGVKFDTKAAALEAAVNIWPDHSWLASKRCSIPHDGMVDAALLAQWGKYNINK